MARPYLNRTLQKRQAAHLIGSHEAAIALNVGREDSNQPAPGFSWVCQGCPVAEGFVLVI
jgi:hypothetical protein